MTKKILVTGCTGLVGHGICLCLLSKGHEVWGTSRSKIVSNHSLFHPIILDLEDELSLKEITKTLDEVDILIHNAALIPGKKAPIIIKKDMIEVMQNGSVIYDLAASQGGNSELTKVNEIIDSSGVKIMGESNILNKLPVSASNLYSKNMFNFVNNLFNKEKKSFEINYEDEIIEKTKIK